MVGLGSAPVPEVGADDHVTGEGGSLVVEYGDFECPFCAVLSVALSRAPVRTVFRHFPVRSSHPRAWPAACAAEAADVQGRFWEMHEALFADQGRLEDPHLWERAAALGLDLERFDSDRRGEAARERVQRDFRSGIRAGVVTTPSVFIDGELFAGKAAIAAVEDLGQRLLSRD